MLLRSLSSQRTLLLLLLFCTLPTWSRRIRHSRKSASLAESESASLAVESVNSEVVNPLPDAATSILAAEAHAKEGANSSSGLVQIIPDLDKIDDDSKAIALVSGKEVAESPSGWTRFKSAVYYLFRPKSKVAAAATLAKIVVC